MGEYRIDAMPTGAQQSVMYLHGVESVVNNADVIMFLDKFNNIIAVVPVPARIAYTQI